MRERVIECQTKKKTFFSNADSNEKERRRKKLVLHLSPEHFKSICTKFYCVSPLYAILEPQNASTDVFKGLKVRILRL